MELSVLERMILLGILQSAEGDLTTLKIIRDLTGELSFDEEEHKLLNIKQEGQQTTWDQPLTKEIDIGKKGIEAILGAFRAASNKKSLKAVHLEVYERFEKEVEDGT